MKAVIQRVNGATLSVGGKVVSSIGRGLVVYLGIYDGDGMPDVDKLCKKLVAMRIFEDENGKLNLSVRDIGGSILLVSNFTLCGDISRGNRPDFRLAMRPEPAQKIFDECARMLDMLVPTVTGVFGADMTVEQSNAGPVTIIY